MLDDILPQTLLVFSVLIPAQTLFLQFSEQLAVWLGELLGLPKNVGASIH
jgi:hypothetical protein